MMTALWVQCLMGFYSTGDQLHGRSPLEKNMMEDLNRISCLFYFNLFMCILGSIVLSFNITLSSLLEKNT